MAGSKQPPTADGWRVFCAVEIPEPVRKQLVEHVSRLKEGVPEVHASWTRAENIHLTLKFFGEIPESDVDKVSLAAAQTVARAAPFEISVEETGAFPTGAKPRVLWIGIKDPKGLLGKVHRTLEDTCLQGGFSKEARGFHPHLTIARLRSPQGARTLAAAHKELAFEPARIIVSELLVMRSELGRNGSKYSVISRHPLDKK